MTRQAAHYHRLKAEVHRRLGGKCAVCGTAHQLSVDHLDSRDYEVRELSSQARMKRYLEELEARVPLRLVCRDCDPNMQAGRQGSGHTGRAKRRQGWV